MDIFSPQIKCGRKRTGNTIKPNYLREMTDNNPKESSFTDHDDS